MKHEFKPDEQLIPIERAKEQAALVRETFAEQFERWEFAGSLRREMEFVGDIEHIVIPRRGLVQTPGMMFPELVDNQVNHTLDGMIESRLIEKAKYGEKQTTRWGVKSRSFMMNGIRHEVYTATVDTWGVVMALRTGPSQLSKRLVSQIKANHHVVKDGNQVFPKGRETAIPMKTEKEFFAICGVAYREPKDRKP